VLDLAGAQDVDLGRLVGIVWALRHAAPGVDLVVRGLKTLWTLAQVAGADAADLIERLFDAGATFFESSPEESERDMTPTEVTALHAKIHAQGVRTQAKVELDAPAQGVSSGATAGAPVWETFVRRVMSLASLARTSGKLTGLSVEVSEGSFVTAVEYMRAIAVARLAGDGIPAIVAPLERIPTVSPAMGLGTACHQHPAEKIAALALHYGAEGVGAIDVTRLSPIAIMQTIRAAGLRPLLREAATTPAFLSHLEGLRHVPALPVAT